MIEVEESFFAAGKKADEFCENTVYSEIMCGNLIEAHGMNPKTFLSAINSLQDGIGICKDAKMAFGEFFQENRYNMCCLPKGHKGKCYHSYKNFFPKQYENKFMDCKQAPGNMHKVFFKNRCGRVHPIQITKSYELELRLLHGKKINYGACIPIEFASTRFGCATAEFDLAALLTRHKGIAETLPSDIKSVLDKHAEYLIEYYKELGIYIEKEGYLCDWVTGKILESGWWAAEVVGNEQIQFGHVVPVKSDEYMTRGLNVLPMTKRGNMIQGDDEPETVTQTQIYSADHMKGSYEHNFK